MNSKTTINSVNDFAKTYDDYIKNGQWIGTDLLFGLMYEYLIANQTILDIGIGTGLNSMLFNTHGLTIYGIDGSDEMINISREKGIAQELRQVDLTKNDIWFENIEFDHVISHGVFHLIGDLNYIFNQTSKILKINGCFGFTIKALQGSEDDYKESSVAGIYEHQNLQSGLKVYRHTEKYIFEQIEKYGFQLLKKTEFLAFVDPNTKSKTYFDVFIAKRTRA